MPARKYAPSTTALHAPAPVGGINTIVPGSAMPPGDAVYCYNLIGSENGLRSRLGYREWATGLTGATDTLVRTILPFTGSNSTALFATTSTGIWDVTASTTTPALATTAFATTTGRAGFGTSCVMSTPAGRFLLYVDEENGYYVYSEGSATWTKVAHGSGAAQVDNVDPATLAHVTVWKNRVWLTEKGTSRAWYLDTNAIYGAATAFDFGPRMRAGGHLVGLYDWSYDGGSGMDTLLVGLSAAGDVVIYQGTDPASADTFGLKGSWFVGGLPSGRRVATDYGGDLLLLSLLGVLPLSRLVVGKAAVDSTQYATAKIANLINKLTGEYGALNGWGLYVHPTDNALLLAYPTKEGQATSQLAMSFATQGWSEYRDLPLYSAGTWQGQLYFGTADGRVCANTGYVDGLQLANPNAYTPVAWSVLPGFTNLGRPTLKRLHALRPIVLSESQTPPVSATAKFDFDATEPPPPTGTLAAGEGTWDGSTWDATHWGGEYTPTQALVGASGMGRFVSVALRGSAVSRTTLVGVDVHYDEGGLL